jgi:hypothetical protein
MTAEIPNPGRNEPTKAPEDTQRQTVRIIGGGIGLFSHITTFPIPERRAQSLEAEQTETGHTTERHGRKGWILRLYGALGLSELRKKFPHGTYSAIDEYASKGSISEIDSTDQNTK